jgi:hypothetical protein
VAAFDKPVGPGCLWLSETSSWGDIVRRSIIRSVAITTVLSGTILTATGVAAAADQRRPTGGDDPSAQGGCTSSDRYSDPGCMLGWGPLFR